MERPRDSITDSARKWVDQNNNIIKSARKLIAFKIENKMSIS